MPSNVGIHIVTQTENIENLGQGKQTKARHKCKQQK